MADTFTAQPIPISEYAIVVNPNDNVAVVKAETVAGLTVALLSGERVTVEKAVPPGHRFATREIPKGDFVKQYGQPIGTSLGIASGEWVTHDNMSDDVPVVRNLANGLQTPAPDYFPKNEIETFMGFRRPDGRVGTRNYVLIVPTSMCASHEATQISMMSEFLHYSREKFPNVDGVVAIPHNKGCGCQDGSTLDVMMRTLSNYADHPNVGGVILIDLGCEKTNLSFVEKYLTKREKPIDKPLFKIGIQDVGGTQAAIELGLKEVEKMLPEVNRCVREEFPVSELVLGVKCGSSDGFSGISANPALGYCSDLLVRSRGTVLLTEVPEMCGAEHILAGRAKDAATGRKIYAMVDWYKEYASKFGAVLNQNPSTGNKAGGLLNITIKSLGAIVKAGTTRIEDTVEYAETPKSRGVNLMQGPGYDQESTPGLVAAGATAIVFTTGNGTTIGNAIAPVIKLASNNRVFERMSQDLDISAGNVIEGTESISDVGTRLFEQLRQVASGDIQTKAELLKHREFQFWAEQTVSL
ncbi:MAG TPA: altronate dehydratase family protein [Pyrinomonadaceae bacterium]|jgi:altronate hydrolase|nr:altronate dehydratase family protein [Pyrinomonadaceae bacterium]